jgi:ketosteroid isomerase-like protein
MAKVWVSFLFFFGALLPFSSLPAQQKPDAEKVREMEMQLTDAYKHRQVEVFAPMLDEDFVITFEDGSTYSKTGYLSYSVTTSTRVDQVEMTDLKIRMHGNTAIVTGTYHERGQDKNGPYDSHDRFTDVWMKKGGKWVMIAAHYATPYKH